MWGEGWPGGNTIPIVLLAASPLLRSILSEHVPPPACSPLHLSIPAATQEVLLVVRDILIMGTVAGVGPAEVMEVKQVLKMLMIEASLVRDIGI